MTKNPFHNAILAFGYVAFVVSILRLGEYLGTPDTPDSFLIPIAMLSLFVLSAATMTYLFFYQPIMMFLEGDGKEAVHLFVRTVAFFAVLTFIVLSIAMLLM